MNAAIYVRVSTRDKGQDTENQLRQLRAYCDRRGYDVAGVYQDNESGRKGRAERAAFDRLFRDAARGQFDLVLFWSLDRFSREGISQTIHYLRQLEAHGVHFNSYTEEHLSTKNELVRSILLSTLAYFAHHESERISERTKAGMERARAGGEQMGRPSKVEQILPVLREIRVGRGDLPVQAAGGGHRAARGYRREHPHRGAGAEAAVTRAGGTINLFAKHDVG